MDIYIYIYIYIYMYLAYREDMSYNMTSLFEDTHRGHCNICLCVCCVLTPTNSIAIQFTTVDHVW